MNTALTVGSLFSGYGGLELGLRNALRRLRLHAHVLWQAEANAYRRAVLRKHWPRVRRYEDVRDIETPPIVDILCGGFPCQDLSFAGRMAGLSGPRSGLWWEFARVIRLVRPSVVFVENVRGLQRYLGDVLGPLASLGFDAEWDCFEAAAVGAPHRRERIFLLAYTDGFKRRAVARRRGSRGRAESSYGSAAANAPGSGCEGRVDSAPSRRAEGNLRVEPPRPRRWRWPAEPRVGRVVDGSASRLDARRRCARIYCLGDGVVPAQAEVAFLTLAERAGLFISNS